MPRLPWFIGAERHKHHSPCHIDDSAIHMFSFPSSCFITWWIIWRAIPISKKINLISNTTCRRLFSTHIFHSWSDTQKGHNACFLSRDNLLYHAECQAELPSVTKTVDYVPIFQYVLGRRYPLLIQIIRRLQHLLSKCHWLLLYCELLVGFTKRTRGSLPIIWLMRQIPRAGSSAIRKILV